MCDAAYYGALLPPVVDKELKKFVGLRHLNAFEHGAHAQIGFHECVEVDIGSLRRRLPRVDFVLFLDIFQTLHLTFDYRVFNLLEE